MKLLDIQPINPDGILDIIKQKFPESKGLEYVKIPTNKIEPSALHVYTQRLQHAKEMYKLCNEKNIDFGAPYIEIYTNGKKHIVVPPIVELRDNRYLLCDGMHRLYIFKKVGIQNVYCILVQQPTLPLAGEINVWENVTVEKQQLPVNMNFIKYNPKGLTGYSHFCNGEEFWENNVK